MAEFNYELKIPKQRIAILVGTKGKVKRHIEELTGTNINIDSKEGEIILSGTDSLNLYTTQTIIKAIGRGFSPEKAELLLKPDYILEIINIGDHARNSEDILRLKGRLIGKAGKCRASIEALSQCFISVYGKTVSIIGLAENTGMAKRAIENLLRGSPHSKVYSWLEQKRGELRKEHMLDFYKKEEKE